MKEIYSIVKTDVVAAPQTSTTAAVTGEITLNGDFDALTVAVAYGTGGTLEIKVEEYNGTEYVAADPMNIIGATPDSDGVVKKTDGTAAGVFEFGYAGIADKIKVSVTPSAATPHAILAKKGHFRLSPPAR